MIPKFSIRQLLLLMVAIGVVSACMAGAARGNTVAFGLAVGILATAIPFLAYAVIHWVAFVVALLSDIVFDRRNAMTTQDSGRLNEREGQADG